MGAKRDFRKIPGGGTEHCEQIIPARKLNKYIDSYELEVFSSFSGLRKLGTYKNQFLNTAAADIQKMVEKKVNIWEKLGDKTSEYVLGSAGSGEQLRSSELPFLDGLIHGRRRWFFMNPESFHQLRRKAAEALEAVSAFVFFEQQYTELKEDFGLGKKKMKFMECNQEVGDLVYVPADMIRTTLALEDSISYTEKIIINNRGLGQYVNDQIYSPSAGIVPNSFAAMACYNWDMAQLKFLGEGMVEGYQGQIIPQIMTQNFGYNRKATNLMILGIITQCYGAKKAPSINVLKTHCPKIWKACAKTLKNNLKALSISVPDWLNVKWSKHGRAHKKRRSEL